MYFKAETIGKKFEINVKENKTSWSVEIKPEGQDWKHYEVAKSDYQYLDNTISFIFKNTSYLVDTVGKDTNYSVYTRGTYRDIKIYNEEAILHESLKSGGGIGMGSDLVSGMPGKIVKVFVKPGQSVKAGDPLIVMEAMKMENEMKADKDAVVKSVAVKPGDSVDKGTQLISFEKQ